MSVVKTLQIGAGVLTLTVAVLAAAAVLTTPDPLADNQPSLVALAAVVALLAGYAFAGIVGAPRTWAAEPRVLQIAAPLGLLAALIYGGEIGLEYALLPADNTVYGLVEFGGVLGLFVVGGFMATFTFGRWRMAQLTSIWIALISALCWYVVLLAVFLAFRGSVRQDAVLRAEGDYEDFRRSGMTDFARWLVQDMLGAGFYHLLLSPLFGAALGGLGAGLGLIARRVWRR